MPRKAYGLDHWIKFFNDRVDRSKGPDECWIWIGTINRESGYGHFVANGKTIGAHRFAYELAYGPIPKDNDICHKCDVRLCVNPKHLFAGTRQDNITDMVNKNRQAYGERHRAAKLTWDEVDEIKKLLQSGWGQEELGKKFNVHQCTIADIKHNRTWTGPRAAGASSRWEENHHREIHGNQSDIHRRE